MSTATALGQKTTSEIRNVAISYVGVLDAGEDLSGVPTVTEVTTTDLTIANERISVVVLTINGISVAIAQAVQFKVSGGVAGKLYTIKISVSSTATPAQTFVVLVKLKVFGE